MSASCEALVVVGRRAPCASAFSAAASGPGPTGPVPVAERCDLCGRERASAGDGRLDLAGAPLGLLGTGERAVAIAAGTHGVGTARRRRGLRRRAHAPRPPRHARRCRSRCRWTGAGADRRELALGLRRATPRPRRALRRSSLRRPRASAARAHALGAPLGTRARARRRTPLGAHAHARTRLARRSLGALEPRRDATRRARRHAAHDARPRARARRRRPARPRPRAAPAAHAARRRDARRRPHGGAGPAGAARGPAARMAASNDPSNRRLAELSDGHGSPVSGSPRR